MSWPKVRLGDVCDTINGLWKGVKPPFITVGVIRSTNFSKNCEFSITPKNTVYIEVEEKKYLKRKLHPGDLIVERSGGGPGQPVGRVVLFDRKDGEFTISNFTSILRIKQGTNIDPMYLQRCLTSFYVRGETDKIQSHTIALHNLDFDAFLDFQLPLPPLAEQKKIVEKVEKALRRVDALKAQFERMEKSAADYFKAALAETFAAVKGEKVKLGDVCEIAYGYTAKSRCDDGNGDPKYLRITDIQDDSVDWSRVPVCQCDDIRSYLLAQGDIVFARTGATTGKSFLLEGDFPKSVYASYLIRVKLRNKRIVPQYLRWYFDTESYWSVIRCGMAGAAQGGFNSKKLAALEIPVPSVEEQIRIDQIMRQAKVKKENLIYFARRCIGICGKMRKAILAEAFQ